MELAYAATSHTSSSSAGGGILILLLTFAIAICYIVAWVFTMQIVTKAAKEKGYENLSGKLWFIGLFGLIVTPCVIVAALPDKKLQGASIEASRNPQDDLPAI